MTSDEQEQAECRAAVAFTRTIQSMTLAELTALALVQQRKMFRLDAERLLVAEEMQRRTAAHSR